jgi:hypothetical protein
MDINALQECADLSFAGRTTFPEVVRRMAKEDIRKGGEAFFAQTAKQ